MGAAAWGTSNEGTHAAIMAAASEGDALSERAGALRAAADARAATIEAHTEAWGRSNVEHARMLGELGEHGDGVMQRTRQLIEAMHAPHDAVTTHAAAWGESSRDVGLRVDAAAAAARELQKTLHDANVAVAAAVDGSGAEAAQLHDATTMATTELERLTTAHAEHAIAAAGALGGTLRASHEVHAASTKGTLEELNATAAALGESLDAIVAARPELRVTLEGRLEIARKAANESSAAVAQLAAQQRERIECAESELLAELKTLGAADAKAGEAMLKDIGSRTDAITADVEQAHAKLTSSQLKLAAAIELRNEATSQCAVQHSTAVGASQEEIGAFFRIELHMDESVAVVPDHAPTTFSRELSITPSDADILRTANLKATDATFEDAAPLHASASAPIAPAAPVEPEDVAKPEDGNNADEQADENNADEHNADENTCMNISVPPAADAKKLVVAKTKSKIPLTRRSRSTTRRSARKAAA